MGLALIAITVVAFIIWALFFNKPRQSSAPLPLNDEDARYRAQQYEDRGKAIIAAAAARPKPRSKPPVRRTNPPPISRAPKPTPVTPFVSSPPPAPAQDSSGDLLLGAVIGYEVAHLLESNDRPADTSPSITSGDGGDFGGGGASGSWDSGSSDSSSSSDSSD